MSETLLLEIIAITGWLMASIVNLVWIKRLKYTKNLYKEFFEVSVNKYHDCLKEINNSWKNFIEEKFNEWNSN